MKIKVRGWEFLSFEIKNAIEQHIKAKKLGWVIIDDRPLDRYDFAFDVDDNDENVVESTKAYLGALIFMLLWAELSEDPGIGGLALSMTPPGKTPNRGLSK